MKKLAQLVQRGIYCAILEVPLELKSVQVFWLKNVEN
jgi:hypothetical protein